jgi:hypothetical protein
MSSKNEKTSFTNEDLTKSQTTPKICCSHHKHKKSKIMNILLFVLFPVIGLFSLIWFLIRVIPKPSRATYPCQRAAFPLASGFIIWLAGLIGSTIAYRKAKKLFLYSRRVTAVFCIIISISCIWMSLTTYDKDALAADSHPANQPLGAGHGIYPGRVTWIYNPDAAKWPGGENVNTPPYWHSDECTNPVIVNDMLVRGLLSLTGESSEKNAWNTLFQNFNEQMGRGKVGYQQGEKIAIKVNFVVLNSSDNGSKPSDRFDQIDNSPQVTIALLKQLTDVVGVKPGDISIGDPSQCMPTYWYDMVSAKCPGVVYLTEKSNTTLTGRTQVSPDYNAPFYWSDPVTSRVQGKTQDYIPTHFAQAKYFINSAVLKSHTQNGITVTAKNHFGSLRLPQAGGYYDMHSTRAQETPSIGQYRCLVDLMGHPKLGGKTLLFLVDGLYSGRGWDSVPKRWTIEPFNGNWPSSLFLSQDGVAIDSVAFDFLFAQWTGSYSGYDGYPQRPGTDDYLHEAALADNPPSGAKYDPAHDGGLKKSLGIHEHWNNVNDKKYSRNLGTGEGIELVTPTFATENGPVHNTTQKKNYDYIQYAIMEASNGDIITVSPGTYNENINFKGKSITLSSENPNDPAIVAKTIISGSSQAVTFAGSETAASILRGFTITGTNIGIYCSGASPVISNCRVIENKGNGIDLASKACPTISYCEISCNMGSGISVSAGQGISPIIPIISNSIIAANRLIGINGDFPIINNCTIAANGQQGVTGKWPKVNNSIVYYNNIQIDSSSPIVKYSDVQGGYTGTSNINSDPCFAEIGFWDTNDTTVTSDDTWKMGDYHLLSQVGRWVPADLTADPNKQHAYWAKDSVSSPCIDAGDPNISFGDELWPHGKRINMGAYGGSLQASMSSSNAGDIIDLNNDNQVTWNDILLLGNSWKSNIAPLKGDFNLDGIVDTNDLQLYAGNWIQDSNNAIPQFDFTWNNTVTIGDIVSAAITATDTDNDNDDLVYAAFGLPDGASFSNQIFTWTAELAGTYQITFVVTDNKSLAYQTVTLTVVPVVPEETE